MIWKLENCLLVFEELCEENFNKKEFSKLAAAGRHKNISVISVKHNLFQQSKWPRINDLNTTHIILFKSPRDIQQIGLIGRQLNNTQFLNDSYELATKQPFGHLLIDLDPKTSDVIRYCSILFHQDHPFFYFSPAKAVITNLSNEKERALCAAANVRDIEYSSKELIKSAPNTFINFLCECLLNVVNGNVPVKKTLIQGHEIHLKNFYLNKPVKE